MPQLRVIVDTREQKPWRFSPQVETTSRSLPVGDYSIEGHEDLVMIERKSREDAVSTIIHARKRFHTELGKMRSAAQAGGLAVVIVESGLPELLRLNPNVHKKSLVASLASIHVRFGVPVLFCGNRGVASFYAERLMMDWWNAFGIKGSAAMADGEASS